MEEYLEVKSARSEVFFVASSTYSGSRMFKFSPSLRFQAYSASYVDSSVVVHFLNNKMVERFESIATYFLITLNGLRG